MDLTWCSSKKTDFVGLSVGKALDQISAKEYSWNRPQCLLENDFGGCICNKLSVYLQGRGISVKIH